MGMIIYNDLMKAWGFIYNKYGKDYKISEMESLEQKCFVLIPKEPKPEDSNLIRIYDYGTSIGLVLMGDNGKAYGHEIVIEALITDYSYMDTIGECMHYTYKSLMEYKVVNEKAFFNSLLEAIRLYFKENYMLTDLRPYRNHLWIGSPLCKIAHSKTIVDYKLADENMYESMLQEIKDFIDEYGFYCVLRTLERIINEEKGG